METEMETKVGQRNLPDLFNPVVKIEKLEDTIKKYPHIKINALICECEMDETSTIHVKDVEDDLNQLVIVPHKDKYEMNYFEVCNQPSSIKTEIQEDPDAKKIDIEDCLETFHSTNSQLSNAMEVKKEESKVKISSMNKEIIYITDSSSEEDQENDADNDNVYEDVAANFVDDDNNYSRTSLTRPNHQKHQRARSFNKGTASSSKMQELKCQECNIVFEDEETLLKHQIVHYRPNRPFKCKLCSKFFTARSSALLHIRKVHRKTKSYVCDICEKKFFCTSSLGKHMHVHMREKPYQCIVCKKRFTTKHGFATHKKLHTGEFKCDQCKKAFRSKWWLQKHLSAGHPSPKSVPKFKCHICSREFTMKVHLQSHRNQAHSVLYPCEVCGKTFRNKTLLATHQWVAHSFITTKKLSCSICKLVFSTFHQLWTHLKVQTKTYKCCTCAQVFKSLYLLKIHGKIHRHGGSFKCNQCNKFSNDERGLKRHKQRVHEQKRRVTCEICHKAMWPCAYIGHKLIHLPDKPFKCFKCSDLFLEILDLEKHINEIHLAIDPYKVSIQEEKNPKRSYLTRRYQKTYHCKFCILKKKSPSRMLQHAKCKHLNIKPYKCSQCVASFGDQRTLANHQLTHTTERLHLCSICKKSFKSPNTVAKHMKTHRRKKTHICKVCGKGFSRSDTLKVHEKTHEDRRPFQCQKCPKAYFTKHTLKEHMKVHTNAKPFQCDVCKKAFTYKGDLKKHLLTHSAEPLYKCPECGHGFNAKANMNSHIDKVHKNPKKKCRCPECGKECRTHYNLQEHMEYKHQKFKNC